MTPPAWLLVLLFIMAGLSASARKGDLWVKPGEDGQNQIQFYFFWSLTCEHCAAAHPHISAIPRERPWARLYELELSRNIENVERFEQLVRGAGAQ